MKALARKTNVIPVIAKADALTQSELLRFKHVVTFTANKQVLWTLQENQIPIYPYSIPERKRFFAEEVAFFS